MTHTSKHNIKNTKKMNNTSETSVKKLENHPLYNKKTLTIIRKRIMIRNTTHKKNTNEKPQLHHKQRIIIETRKQLLIITAHTNHRNQRIQLLIRKTNYESQS